MNGIQFINQKLARLEKQKQCLPAINVTYEQLYDSIEILKSSLTEQKSDVVGILLNDYHTIAISALGILATGKSYVILDSMKDEEDILEEISTYQIGSIITEQELVPDQLLANNERVTLSLQFGSGSKNIEVFTISGVTGGARDQSSIDYFESIYSILEFDDRTLYIQSNYFNSQTTVDIIIMALIHGTPVIIDYEQLVNVNVSFSDLVVCNHKKLFTREMASSEEVSDIYKSSSKIFVVGDTLLLHTQVKDWAQKIGNQTELIFGYSPFNVSAILTYYKVNLEYIDTERNLNIFPIGKPVVPDRIKLLDHRNRKVPIGVKGKMYLSTRENLSYYYPLEIKRVELKTGESLFIYDLTLQAIQLPDGNLKLDLGSMENDGHPSYLKLIEEIMLEDPSIEEVKVTAHFDQQEESNQVVAFVRFSPENKTNLTELRKYLHSSQIHLNHLIEVDSFPLSKKEEIDLAFTRKEVEPELDEQDKKLSQIIIQILNKRTIQLEDNIFELGCTSINALQLIARINSEFNTQLDLQLVFDCQTVKDIFDKVKKSLESPKCGEIPPIREKEYYDVTHAQKRMWVLAQYDEASVAYNEFFAYHIQDYTSVHQLQQAIEILIDRHELLRSVYVNIEGEPKQKILDYLPVENVFSFVDVTHYLNKQEYIREFLDKEKMTRFDLEQGPLLRVHLFQLDSSDFILSINIHHIISDAWSDVIMFQELLVIYQSLQKGLKPNLVPLNIQYKDYAAWQNEQLSSEKAEVDRKYWLEQFNGEIPLLRLPSYKPRPRIQSFNGETLKFTLSSEVKKAIEALKEENNTTLLVTFLTLLKVLFYKYTNQSDIIVGTTLANRLQKELENQIGLFIDTTPIRTHFQLDENFKQVLSKVKQKMVEAVKHGLYPFDQLVNDLNLKHDISRSPLFDVLVEVLNFDTLELDVNNSSVFNVSALNIKPIEIEEKTSLVDLAIYLTEQSECLEFIVRYNTDIFDAWQIEALKNHFEKLVLLIHDHSETEIIQLSIVLEEEYKLIEKFNQNHWQNPSVTLPTKLAELAKSYPTKQAVAYQEEKVTYHDVVEEANQVAHLLVQNDIPPESVVGILMDRSPDMIKGILGSWKAGAAYMPMDPNLPYDRMKYMVTNAQVSYLLFSSKYIKEANQLQWECPNLKYTICVDHNNFPSLIETERESMRTSLWKYVIDKSETDIEAGMWFNSYTGLPYSRKEMDEYGDNVLIKLKPYLNKGKTKVLEIGCSSGITMYRIAPHVKKYVGIDMSKEIIEKNQKIINQKGIDNIELYCKYAHEIHELEEKDFDIIIINGVIQYFNGQNYLRNVINKTIEKSNHDSLIFFGDIIDLDKKEEFVQSLIEFKQQNKDKGYRTWTDWSEYLFISRLFFDDLMVDFPEIQDMQHTEKIYTLENELTSFRYDTIAQINKNQIAKSESRRKNKYQYDLNDIQLFRNASQIDYSSQDKLAYVIYTSGSTGQPKGAMIEHKGMLNHIYAKINDLQLENNCVVAQNSSQSFDISVWQMFAPLMVGGQVCIYDNNLIMNPYKFVQQITADKVTVLEVVPSYLTSILEIVNTYADLHIFTHLNYLMITGEEVKVDLVNGWFELFPTIKMVNAYGPTEASDDITHYMIEGPINAVQVPIGKPLQNFSIYIVDDLMRRVPIGVIGEIWVSGFAVGRGYLRDEERTKQAFIDDPFIQGEKVRLYKTGDLGRWRVDGTIDYFGRKDQQVKMRGFRIELGEIEQILAQHEKIKQVVVIDHKDQDENVFLCAYIVEEEKTSVRELEEYLGSLLPEYMIPGEFIFLEKMPLTLNGKIDRKALKIAYQSKQEEIYYVPPADEVEEKLVDICQEVLSVERVGVNDDFFMLGGHSLKATILIAKIYKTFNVELALIAIFNNPNIREIANFIKQSKTKEYRSIIPVEEKLYYEVSPAQKRMFLLNRIENIGLSYNAPQVFYLQGNLNLDKVMSCFQQLIDRHEALRTSFIFHEGEVVQQIHDQGMFQIEYVHVDAEGANLDSIISQYIQPFDLSKAPLFRVHVLKLSNEKHLFIFDQHHIISDGVSVNILINEFCMIYNGMVLSELKIQYKDFSVWQNRLMNSDHLKKQEEYWLQVFSKDIESIDLPYDYPRPKHQSHEGDIVSFKIPRETRKMLDRLTRQTGSTMYMLLLSAFNVLLTKYSGQDDIIVGSPIAGRQHPELENIIGVFINILCMRNNPKPEQKFVDFLQEVKVNTLQGFENQDYQFEELVDKLHLPRDLSRNPIFDIMFVLQNMNKENIEFDDLIVTPYEFKQKTTQYDLKLEITETEDELICIFEYCTRLFKEETIDLLANQFSGIIRQVTHDPNIKLADIKTITPSEEAFLQKVNDTWADIPADATVHQLFEEQVMKNPSLIAVTDEEKSFTFDELNMRANQLAHHLISIGVRQNEPIGLITGTNISSIVGILGILKAGATYVPIDPTYPIARISYILEHSEARVLIGDGAFDLSRLNLDNVETVINLFNQENELAKTNTKYFTYKEIKEQPTSNLNLSVNGNDTMYIMYTSGSTGLPKGVVVKHTNVVNFILWGIQTFEITSDDNLMQVTSNSFDISLFEIFGSLLSSASLHIVSKREIKNPKLLVDFMYKKQVTIWHSVPTLMAQLQTVSQSNRVDITQLENVRLVMLGGEAWSINLAKQIKQTFVNAEMYNMYGPTEATIWISSYKLTQSIEEISTIPIGKPVSNNKLYILDENQQPCGMNIPGEIYISGRSITGGYYHNQEETSKRFIRNEATGEVLYRTGDVGRYLLNGNIEFLGRLDHMVKVRGYRIEIAEIEKAMLELKDVQQTVVIQTQDEENKDLICYYTSSKEHNYNHIVEHLEMKLPSYMIPSKFIKLEELPLMPNGKIDRKALPSGNVSKNNNYVKPESSLEIRIAEIWKDILNLDVEIGVYDGFFELGGNSLLVIKLEVELENHRFYKEGMNLFELSTIKKLASYIEQEETAKWDDNNTIIQHSDSIKQNNGSNVIGEINPFNDIFYKNCFYNSAFPVIRYYNRDILSFLVNDIVTYTYEKTEENQLNLGMKFTPVKSVESLLKDQEIYVNTSLVSDQIVSDIIDSINKERPVIIWIDCFYASFRTEKFNREHWPHTWLVYGYDEEEKQFHIIEHKHRDNLMYEKIRVGFNELVEAYNGYVHHFSQSIDQKNPSYYEFFVNYQLKGEVSARKHISVLHDYYKKYQADLVHSHIQLEQFINDFKEIALEQVALSQSIENLLDGMNEVINSKRVEKYRLIHVLGSGNEGTLLVEEILINWEYIRRVVAKYYYSQVYKQESFMGLTEKLRKILKLEQNYITFFEKIKLTIEL